MIGDTIFAVATPPGAGPRGAIRISGPEARRAAGKVLGQELPATRGALEAQVAVHDRPVPCLVLVMPQPASYTGEDVVELHLPGSPLLLDVVGRRLLGCRLATPGEFTRRAFANGKLDLCASEAVLHLIHAASEADRAFALDVLRGGLGQRVDLLRARVQDARALLEAGLDFTAGETGSVPQEAWLGTLQQAVVDLDQLLAGLPPTGIQGELCVLGAANAGKSSLLNALVGHDQALVAARPGTTRDVLCFELAVGAGATVRLLDGPGDLPRAAGVDADALALRDLLAAGAAGAILVVDLSDPAPLQTRTPLPVVAVVGTKLDLCPAAEVPDPPPGAPVFRVSNVDGRGLDELREFLAQQAGHSPLGLEGRVHDALRAARAALARGLAAASGPEEMVAADLQEVVDALERVHGRASPEDLLDRIFARFCLGK
jgi:tRNA modification GTPase